MNQPRPTLTTLVREQLSRFIEQHSGVFLGPEKGYLLEHRLVPIINQYKLAGFEGLRERLIDRQDPELREKVLEAIVTHETAFFRDKHPYETLRHTILTRLAQRWQATRDTLGHRPTPIRIWCAACSTGQEPWSVAMAIHEWIPLSGVSGLGLGDFAILATDLSSKVLDHARQGIYTEADLARGMTPGQISRFLNRQPGAKPTFQMKAELRSMVEFRKANLRESFKSLGLFDLILCRNVLIYFADPLKRQICEGFFQSLLPGGFLMLGAAESLFGINELFQTDRQGETLVYCRPAN